MILPIVAYGHPALKRETEEITPGYPGLHELIENMFETMYASNGVGLAAPQVNVSVRLFVADATPYVKDIPDAADFKKVFINPVILSEEGEEVVMGEGCLSFPGLHENIPRKSVVKVRYYDENFNLHEETWDRIFARVIQHETDHLNGLLLSDRMGNLRKMLLKRKLGEISTGDVDVDYKMIFPVQKKRNKSTR